MTTEALITDLIRRWEEMRAAGQPAAVEEICREHPDLAEDLRERVRLLESMDRRLPPAQSPTAAMPMAATLQRGVTHVSLLRPGHEPIPGYRLIEGLGRGGFGEVWKAAAPGGFQVALKFVLLGGRAGPAEARALELIRHIRHPNLLGTHLALEQDGILVIGMELADGTLGDRLAARFAPGKRACRAKSSFNTWLRRPRDWISSTRQLTAWTGGKESAFSIETSSHKTFSSSAAA